MPWKEIRIMDQRLQFLSSYQKEHMSVADLYRAYGISRPTAYRWINRHSETGPEGLPRSETVSDQWRRTLSDIDAALAVRRRSAHLDVLMEDGTRVYFNLHDPHWRVA